MIKYTSPKNFRYKRFIRINTRKICVRILNIRHSIFRKKISGVLILASPAFYYGNAILLEPAIRLLKKQLPNIKIDLIGSKPYCEIFISTGLIDSCSTWNENIHKNLGTILENNKRRYDVIFVPYGNRFFDFRTELRMAIHSQLLEVGAIRNQTVFQGVHETYENLNVISKMLKCKVAENFAWPLLHLTRQEKRKGNEILNKYKLTNIVIGFHAGSSSNQSWKRWSADSFVCLGNLIQKNYDSSILLFGGPDEEELNKYIEDGIKNNIINLTNISSFRVTSAILIHCDLFISNDSGLMHAANAVGAPLISLFGPTSPDKNGPLGDLNKVKVVTPNVECKHCFVNENINFINACNTKECLNSIEVDTVFESVKMFLTNNKFID